MIGCPPPARPCMWPFLCLGEVMKGDGAMDPTSLNRMRYDVEVLKPDTRASNHAMSSCSTELLSPPTNVYGLSCVSAGQARIRAVHMGLTDVDAPREYMLVARRDVRAKGRQRIGACCPCFSMARESCGCIIGDAPAGRSRSVDCPLLATPSGHTPTLAWETI